MSYAAALPTYSHEVVESSTPATETLRRMGATAIETADTPAFREWAALLATRVPPRDYVAMLAELYRAILQRWRYVPESEEWIHGTPDSLIAHVLGAKYSAPGVRPSEVNVDALRGQPGWGDCDDVSTVVAAAVRAIGMRPLFRVARTSTGAHVSVVARTPAGDNVSVDPVGHPDHPFGWALPAEDVQFFELDGQPSSLEGFSGVDTMAACTAPNTLYAPVSGNGTLLCLPNGQPQADTQTHWVATDSNDIAGPRSLALPEREFRLFQRGITVDGCPAFDENGRSYVYDQPRDMWLSERLNATHLANRAEPFGGIRSRRRANRRRRRAKRRKVLRRVVQRVRKGASRVLKNRLVQAVVSRGVQAVTGTPAIATKAAMRAGSRLFERGGVVGIARRLRNNPRHAARVVAAAGKVGSLRASSRFSGDCGCNRQYLMSQGGARFFAAPVVSLSGVPGLHSFGQLEVRTTLEPGGGYWYRIQRGDNLLTVAERALGAPRLTHSKWINAALANQVFHRPAKAGFEANQYGAGVISFNPNYSADDDAASRGEPGNSYAVIWIPAAPGDEPPDDEPEVEVEPEDEVDEDPVEPELPPDPVTPELPPEDEVEDETPDVVVPSAEEVACIQGGGTWVPGQGCACPPGQVWWAEEQECAFPPPEDDDEDEVDDVGPIEPEDEVEDEVDDVGPVEPEDEGDDMVIPPVEDPIEPLLPPVDTFDPGANPSTGAGMPLWLKLVIAGVVLGV